jgi:amino acid permease
MGTSWGNVVFFIFFLNAFIITVGTLISLNDIISDFCKIFTHYPLLTNPLFCFWSVLITIFSTPFIYNSSDESMTLITILTMFAIFASLLIVILTFINRYGISQTEPIKYFDFSGSVFSFDVSYFSFIVQLNIFDLFLMFKGSPPARFNKIKKVAYYTNFFIFLPYFIMGIYFFLF